MANVKDIMQLCRLCLVKDKVNIPIFEGQGDIGQIFLKISACLPIKVSKEDNLPKNICDGCSYKLESLYEFWNTSVNSEKQLLKWLNQLGIDKTQEKVPHSITTDNIVLKQEVIELAEEQNVDDLNASNQDYILQQQQLPYQSTNFPFQQDGFGEGQTTAGPSATVTSKADGRGAVKRKRRAAAMKPLPPEIESEEDELDLMGTKIAKTEEESDESGCDDPEPTTFVGLPDDNEQPGPSGVGKESADAPLFEHRDIKPTVDELNIKSEILEATVTTPTKKKKKRKVANKDPKISLVPSSKLLKIPEKKKRKVANKDAKISLVPSSELLKIAEKKKHCCTRCQASFDDKHALRRHGNNEHTTKKHPCTTCGRSFRHAYLLRLHSTIHDTAPPGVECETCGAMLKSKLTLMSHVRRLHSTDRKFKCPDCDLAYLFQSELRRHREATHLNLSYKCSQCEKTFKERSSCRVHEKIHRPEHKMKMHSFVCELCGAKLSALNAYRKHMKRHTGDGRKYMCHMCGRNLSSATSLTEHMQVHTGEKPFACTLCDRRFNKKRVLEMHVRTHTKEKPFVCDVCNKAFSQQTPLAMHKRRHTGEKPYDCRLCNKSFVSKSTLSIHVKGHGILQ